MKKFTETIKKIIGFIVLALIIWGICALVNVRPSTTDFDSMDHDEYLVEDGDNLYTICKTVCGEKVNCNEWIDYVKTINGKTSSTIYVGEWITIPIC